jgi:CheY-like chemotaxis protein
MKQTPGQDLRAGTPADTPPGAPGRRAAEGQPVVLVVDDNAGALELMTRSLSREGFRVVGAASGEEGLRRAREVRPAAILLDVVLPGLSGWDVLASLKADPELAPIPVIMTTMLDDRNKGFALGVTEYLLKPIDRGRLSAILKKVRGRAAPGRALIVDDDPDNRHFLTRILAREGWATAEAENGRVALERVAEQAPGLILLDLMMPVMDGFDFVRELRQTRADRPVPVVVLTAKELTREDCLRLSGAVDRVLEKGSYDREELLREIRRLAPRPSPGR